MADHPIVEIYQRLHDFFGSQKWWPGDTPFEIMVGAVLTQNTNWQNVEKAITNLKSDGLLSFDAIDYLAHDELAARIRPSGYYNLKSSRLKNLLSMIRNTADGDLDLFFDDEVKVLREKLLSVKGVGPETADSILLYAAQKPVFVVDAYTHRIFSRHGFIAEDEAEYHQIQDLFISALPEDTQLFNEYHALIVMTAKEFCKKKNPLCEECPLGDLLP